MKNNNNNNNNETEIKLDAEKAQESQTVQPSGEKPKKSRKPFNKRRLRHGTMSVVLTIVFVAAVVVFNVIVGLISERFDTDVDLSDTGMYTLDEDTEGYLEGVTKEVTITVLNSESSFESMGDPYKQVNELLKKMQLANPLIKLDYKQLDQNPAFASKYTGETLSDNYIVVECEATGQHRIIIDDLQQSLSYGSDSEGYLKLDVSSYYNAYYAAYYSGTSFSIYDYISSDIEQEVVSALMFVTNDDPVRVAFTEGYDEGDSSALQQLLEKNGYSVETINLMQVDAVDSDIDFIVIFAPLMDIDNDNITKLDKFLDNNGEFGKNVFYFASAYQPETPNIDAFLSDWGLAVERSLVGQSDSNYVFSYFDQDSYNYMYGYMQQILETDYAGSAYGNSLYTYGSNMRPVVQIWEGGNRGGIEQEILMQSYDGAFSVPLDADEDYDIDAADTGVFNDAVLAYRVHSTKHTLSRVVVFGSDKLASSMFMSYSNANNSKFFINTFNNISGKDEGVTITSKSFATTGFDMTSQQADTLAVFLCIVIPVVVIALGIVIWVRRRHR